MNTTLLWWVSGIAGLVCLSSLTYIAYRILGRVGGNETPISGRAKYGTVRGNLLFLAVVLIVPAVPIVLLLIQHLVVKPLWLDELLSGFLLTLGITLLFVELAVLLLFPLFAENYLWNKHTPEGTLWNPPKRRFLPWVYEVPDGLTVGRLWGGKVYDYQMQQSDVVLACDELSSEPEEWKARYAVIPAHGSRPDIPVYHIWGWYLFKVSGLVFGGVSGFTKLDVYQIDIVKYTVNKSGSIELIVRPNELTDHVRTRSFTWVVVANIYTKDRMFISILITFELQCVNPYVTRVDTDRWERRFNQKVLDRAVYGGGKVSFTDLLGTDATSTRNEIADEIKLLGSEVETDLGLRIQTVQVPGYLTIGDTEAAQKAISAVVVATQNAKAEVIRGEAEAEVEALVVSKRAEAAEKFGKDGVDISLHQALERIAETNKGGSIIVNLGTGEDAFSRAAFAELQKLNEKGGVK